MNEEENNIENEEDKEESALVPITPPSMLAVTPKQAQQFQESLTALKKSILVKGVDYKIDQKTHQTIFHRSGYEKIAFFFRISCKILSTNYREFERQAIEIIRNKDTDKIIAKKPMFDKQEKPVMTKHHAYEVTVKAFCGEISNDAVGACSSDENKTFHHPIHDVYATAHTRAKGRAICAMIGAGLSFEEMASIPEIKRYEEKQRKQIQSSSTPRGTPPKKVIQSR